VHRSPCHRCGTLFRHPAARLVADRRRLRPDCLRQRSGLHRQRDRQADRVRIHMGADAPSVQRHPAFRLGPRLRLQGQ
ncbi:hypothetical protein chiPu_0028047, partial [Chiloscyllium punctatum]|nr:hypothetical protein [Chiloscyllium punctatum]